MIPEVRRGESETVKAYRSCTETEPKARVLVVDYAHQGLYNEDAWLLIAYFDGREEVSVGMTLPKGTLKRLWSDLGEKYGFKVEAQ